MRIVALRANHGGIIKGRRMSLLRTDSNAAVGGLYHAGSTVDRPTLDRRAAHSTITCADSDNQVGFHSFHHGLQPATLRQGFLDIFAGVCIGCWVFQRLASVWTDHHPHSPAPKT
jgi:hypothetical protein